ncbi:hypothetical protein PR003_g22295 [Phytophthora rubi]|uniref:Uncharacterized protein n=1 Tax=Phytophthora rubi TaxID=129364 RepID=A0A6A3KAR4_9STRA|nr:hypothetical protein PR002_g18515 [Phytophthora rubi]KAE9002647.1 hypothetical protein PR001_g18193 [Phytophthora rubi]KAE9302306.1 hypothetical protein PR003_g22295 [Phytophthora rubi]
MVAGETWGTATDNVFDSSVLGSAFDSTFDAD